MIWSTLFMQVLSVETALSIQSHPDKPLAEQLHAQSPQVSKFQKQIQTNEDLCTTRRVIDVIIFPQEVDQVEEFLFRFTRMTTTSQRWPLQSRTLRPCVALLALLSWLKLSSGTQRSTPAWEHTQLRAQSAAVDRPTRRRSLGGSSLP